MSELLWPAGRAGKTIIQSVIDAVGYWRRFKTAQRILMAAPQHLLGDLGICPMQIPAIAAYAAVAQVNITAAIDYFARLPPAPLPVLHDR